MSPGVVSIVREADDRLCDVRVSIGRARAELADALGPSRGTYIVFRGEPKDVIEVLEDVLTAAKRVLPDGEYVDTRQGLGATSLPTSPTQ